MKYQLIKKNAPVSLPTKAQIAYNRGIPLEDLKDYINISSKELNDPEEFGEESLKRASACLAQHIAQEDDAIVIVDSDCDGYTSAALIINYLYEVFPSWVDNHLTWFMHEGKQHGLEDNYRDIIESTNKLVIAPDSASNDYKMHAKLSEAGIDVIILDHHEAAYISKDAITINNQLSDYPNKELSGVGVTWQFCRYLDKMLEKDCANNYLDLVALGLTGDMMSLLSKETRYLINLGFQPDNIKNPFIYNMWQKNKFKLGENITSIGAAFYIVPFVNALTRSGTQEEKEILFKSMLKKEAFTEVLSDKRGHRLGEVEQLVDKAMRVCTNVKNRQTKAQDAGMALLEEKIENENLLDHKVLLFTLERDDIPGTIRGLVANKLMAKYQRPCCVLTKGEQVFQGSARGYDKSGFTNFKDICSASTGCAFAQGHQGAFGLAIKEDELDAFIAETDAALKDMSADPIYMVDYIFNKDTLDEEIILDVADMESFYGKDFDEPFIALEKLTISKDMVTIMGAKQNTLKIMTPAGIPIIKFNATEAEIAAFTPEHGDVVINAICKCNKNEWMESVTGQLFLEDYEILKTGVLESWGF